ncbi:FAD binding domain protein [Cladochytrium replicatum]|nr:FAD binding domain protein [Cladochytrium replicatum]
MSSTSLNIVIIGAGIAGTVSARVLREQHNVLVVERAKKTSINGGQSIGFGPNGLKIVKSLGFDFKRAKMVPGAGIKQWDTAGNIVKQMDMDVIKDYGSEWGLSWRLDARDEFLRLATEPGEKIGAPSAKQCEILYETEVTEVDPETGTVHLSSGRVVHADLVIAADGAHSKFQKLVTGSDDLATPTGRSMFRFLLQKEDAVKFLGRAPEVFDATKPAYFHQIQSTDGTDRVIIAYACSDMNCFNVSCIAGDGMIKEKAIPGSWFQRGNKDDMLKLFNDFPEWIKELMNACPPDDLRLWALHEQDPLPNYVRGRMVLIGDAAHSMTPLQGQGGSMAIEDAEGFRLFLGSNFGPEDVPTILKQWESVRRPRATQVQMNTASARQNVGQNAWKAMHYNWTYGGIHEELKNLPKHLGDDKFVVLK